jgi:hypothetical protein
VSSLRGGRSAPAECRCPDSKNTCPKNVRNKLNKVFDSVLDFDLILSDVGTSE